MKGYCRSVYKNNGSKREKEKQEIWCGSTLETYIQHRKDPSRTTSLLNNSNIQFLSYNYFTAYETYSLTEIQEKIVTFIHIHGLCHTYIYSQVIEKMSIKLLYY